MSSTFRAKILPIQHNMRLPLITTYFALMESIYRRWSINAALKELIWLIGSLSDLCSAYSAIFITLKKLCMAISTHVFCCLSPSVSNLVFTESHFSTPSPKYTPLVHYYQNPKYERNLRHRKNVLHIQNIYQMFRFCHDDIP